jgi:nitronate monooxygenase
MTLRTTLCDVLAIEVPILQSGMGGVAGPELVAEVSQAGGLGILAGLELPPDRIREGIRAVRRLTDRPFGVNLWLHTEMRPPVDMATIPESRVRAVHDVLNGFRGRLGLSTTQERPSSLPDVIDAGIEVILEERVPVFSIALGDPGAELVKRCHARGTKVIAMVGSVDDARTVAAAGIDALVAQGTEAGGHRSSWVRKPSRDDGAISTMALVPQVVDAVRVPVIAAGGIADGRGLVAALALGAQGAMLGTRFIATRESAVADFRKKAVLEAESDATTITQSVTGLWARYLRNTFVTEYDASGAPVLPALVQTRAAGDIFADAARREDPGWFPMATGQSAGLIRDLPGAGDVVASIVREARAVLDVLARLPR